MELTLAYQTGTDIDVTCDGQHSHTFDIRTLIPNREKGLAHPLDDPMAYGKVVYLALFPPESLARHGLETIPERILLVTTANDLDAIPWEFAYGPDGFLVLECHFVRGLPAEQRIDLPKPESGMHIIAVPSNPLSHELEPLNIDGEWMRLKEIIQALPYAITLERTLPPTLERLRHHVANQQHRIIHFMGHGGQHETGAILCFEKANGDLDPVTAEQFMLRVLSNVFLVTLNTCASAKPGEAPFSNLAAALIGQKTPYALGMRFSITDDDARAFSRTFYSDLARGTTVEEAVRQARLTLVNSLRPWSIGVPVLYTSLAQPASGFTSLAGSPIIKEHQSRMEVSALPRAEGTFQGRIDELKQLGTLLTGDKRPRMLTIHGGGGQGKTALAREAVERFAYAWPDGIWSTTLEYLPDRAILTNELARFLDINTKEIGDPKEVERQLLKRLASRRMLIVLDNAETLVDAVEANNADATELDQLLQQLPSQTVSLLMTSRVPLNWAGEVIYELSGLSPKEGTNLFQSCAQQRVHEIDLIKAWELSEKLEGHPLSLRLLGSAFNASDVALNTFIEEYEVQLMQAQNKYRSVDHRHRSLYACIDTSMRYLNTELRNLLGGLWIFHSPFLAQTAVAIFDPGNADTKSKPSIVDDHLHVLWHRGLLVRKTLAASGGKLLFYHLLSTTRPYVEQYIVPAIPREVLLLRFAATCANLVRFAYEHLDDDSDAFIIVEQVEADLERGEAYMTGVQQGYYLAYLGWIFYRLGAPRRGLKHLEYALEIAQGQDLSIMLIALHHIALVYQSMGQHQHVISFYEHILTVEREVGDRRGQAATLNNMALAYQYLGQSQRALPLFEQSLIIAREIGNRAGEVVTLNSMALMYQSLSQFQRALTLYEQALPIAREIGIRTVEGVILGNMGLIYQYLGQPQRALPLYKQTLPIRREMGDRGGQAATLNNMGFLYANIGQLKYASNLYEQALLLHREVGDRVGEAATLDNMASICQETGQSQQALTLYEQALSIRRELGIRSGEAVTFNNMALVYQTLGQSQQALSLFEQVLRIVREIGDRVEEARILGNMASVYQTLDQLQQCLLLYEQALSISREIGDHATEAALLNSLAHLHQRRESYKDSLTAFLRSIQLAHQVSSPADEAAGLVGLSLLLYQRLHRVTEAIQYMKQALEVLAPTDLLQDAAGHTTEQMRRWLEDMRQVAASTSQTKNSRNLSEETVQLIITITIFIMTKMHEHQPGWREELVKAQQETQERGADWQVEEDCFTAIIAILDGQFPTLPDNHPYTQAVTAIQEGIATEGSRDDTNADTQAESLLKGFLATYKQMFVEDYLQVITNLDSLFYLSTVEQTVRTESRDVVKSLNLLAQHYEEQGDHKRAELLYKRVLSIKEQQLGVIHPDVASSLKILAYFYKDQGNYEKAEFMCRRALLIEEQQLGANHPSTAVSLGTLAKLCIKQGKYREAEPLLQRALTIFEQQLGPQHSHTATCLGDLAGLFEKQGKNDQAEPLYQRALAIRELQAGPDHPDTAIALNNLAVFYHRLDKRDQAEPLYRRALTINEQYLGSDNPDLVTDLNNLASLYLEQENYEQAELLYQRGLSICEQHLGPFHSETANSLNFLVSLYLEQEKYELAEPLLRRVLAIYDQELGPTHPDTVSILELYVLLLRRRGKETEAMQLETRLP